MKKTKVYILQHVHKIDDMEDVKLIGIYSTKKKAEDAKKRSKKMPGFKQNLKGFSIDEYVIDEDQWAEGFVTE
jgi:hypothetical protein